MNKELNNSDGNIGSYDRQYFLEKESGRYDFRNKIINQRFKDILRLVALSSNDKVLDLGSGRGEMGDILQGSAGEIVLADYSDEALAIIRGHIVANERVRIEKINAKSIPYPDEYFDKVFFLEVIEHLYLPEAEDVLREIKRVLKNGGELILSTGPNKYLSSPQYFIAQKVFNLKTEWGKYHLNEFSYFSLRKAVKKNFSDFKIYCYEDPGWFYSTIKSQNLPRLIKEVTRLLNKVYDLSLFRLLRTKLPLRKFFAHRFILIAKK
ncbi:MAG: class I SAM-dependent methyltransferase [Patescibacteria group bacterium]|jgi:ubiquinone/menaquinone biosynthesis C-methylase UbiE